jgi:hypothetical protein
LLDDMTVDFAAHASSVATFGPNRLVVRFPGMYNSSKTFCERPERKAKLEEALSQVGGQDWRLEFEIVPGDTRPSPVAPPKTSRHQQKRRIATHPLVERAMELFEAEILDVELPPEEPPPKNSA